MPKIKLARIKPETGEILFAQDEINDALTLLPDGTLGGLKSGESCCVGERGPAGPQGEAGKNAFEEITFDVNFQDFKIYNLGDATDPQDATNLRTVQRLLNDFLWGDVIGGAFTSKKVVGLHGRKIIDSVPENYDVLVWDEAQRAWIYRKVSSEIFKIMEFKPLDDRVYEVGEVVSKPSFIAQFNQRILSEYLTNNANSERKDVSDSQMLFHSDMDYQVDTNGGSVEFTLISTSEFHVTESSTTKLFWGARSYWGSSESDDIAEALQDCIDNGDSKVEYQVDNIFYTEANENQYVYYFQDSQYGDTELSVNSIVGGFELVDDNFVHTNDFGVAITYHVYRSEQVNLGKLKVKVGAYYVN